jgi:hypothetical protein
MPKMTKDQFIDELEKRPPAEVSERALIEETEANKDRLAGDQYGVSFNDLRPSEEEAIFSQMVKYGDYKLPGGKNYREILLQLPTFGGKDLEDLMYLEAMERRGGIGTQYGVDRLAMLRKKRDEMGQPYMSPHFEGEPNVLAHMRVQDRLEEQPPEMRYVAFNKNSGFPSPDFATPEELDAYIKTLPANIQNSLVVKQTQVAKPPRKILHVEEIQSDWHQTGRDKGYGFLTSEEQEEMRHLYKLTRDNEEEARLKELRKKFDQVPDAPFKKNWHELAMKRLLNYASENGYDGIAITPGAEQVDRYNLANHIDSLDFTKNSNGTVDISGIKDRSSVIDKTMQTPEQIESLVGKEIARRIFDTTTSFGSLTGLDLKVGGEGMKGFYDKMIPDYLNTFGKKYGSQVELNAMPIEKQLTWRDELQNIHQQNPENKIQPTKQLHYFKITPEMREEVKQGMPLYQQIGVPLGTGAAGAEFEMPQPVQEEEPAPIVQSTPFKHGGKVHVAKNSDTMFMEMSDKKTNLPKSKGDLIKVKRK